MTSGIVSFLLCEHPGLESTEATVREQQYGSNSTGATVREQDAPTIVSVNKNNDNTPPPLTKSEVRSGATPRRRQLACGMLTKRGNAHQESQKLFL
ncbi:hypothetical protein [Okeania sp. KiyG1]|uniref:hypothetical protein n=1 Tax=Okeania sp. KiyG1 TaxID=2720165 RepID=UPI0019215795|nr:hypothetical protein [Okeania sp. KiyG1]